jgi:hypothetical protein
VAAPTVQSSVPDRLALHEWFLPPCSQFRAILSQAVTECSTGHFVQFVGTVAVEDQVVDQAEFQALEDDFGSDGSYG